MSKITQKLPYWVVVSWKRRSIWETTYLTLSKAQKALIEANMQFPNAGWKIEENERYVEIDDTQNDEFSKF